MIQHFSEKCAPFSEIPWGTDGRSPAFAVPVGKLFRHETRNENRLQPRVQNAVDAVIHYGIVDPFLFFRQSCFDRAVIQNFQFGCKHADGSYMSHSEFAPGKSQLALYISPDKPFELVDISDGIPCVSEWLSRQIPCRFQVQVFHRCLISFPCVIESGVFRIPWDPSSS